LLDSNQQSDQTAFNLKNPYLTPDETTTDTPPEEEEEDYVIEIEEFDP